MGGRPPLGWSGRFSESDPPVVGMLEQFVAPLVDHDVMVEPAEKHQILLVGTASLRPGGFVVSLEAISGITAVGGAPTLVFVDESPFQGRRHGALPTPVVEISALFGPGDDLGSRIAEDGLKGLTSHPGTGLEHHPASPSVAADSMASTMTVTWTGGVSSEVQI